MKVLDISLHNTRLYQGCQIRPFTNKGKEGLNLVTPVDSAVVMLAANLRQLIGESKNPAEEWAEVELTGPISPWAYLTAHAALAPHLKRLVHYNGKERIEIPLK